MTNKLRKCFPVLVFLSALSLNVCATTLIWEAPCAIIEDIWDAMLIIVPSLVVIFFTYGILKYAFSADDPGGRKLGKSIMIHSLIGGIIFGLIGGIVTVIRASGILMFCPNINL